MVFVAGNGKGGGEGLLIAIIAMVVLAVWTGTNIGGASEPSTHLPTSGTAQPRTGAPSAPAETSSAEGVYGSSLEMLAAIPARTDERVPEYRRDQFGTGWLDTDGNGCDTRNDILARDLDDIVVDTRCRVLSGTLVDQYTGTTIAFTRGETSSQAVQIDHIFPLAQAWYGGAWRWSDEERAAFANDPAELIAVDGPTNNSKGAKTISQWTPPNPSYQCEYAASYVEVAYLYQLSMSSTDKAAATRILEACG